MDKQILVSLLSLALILVTWPQTLLASQDAEAPAQTTQAPPHAQQTPEQLQRLVAPIALYPDSLVAQILAASTYPEQVVEADRWLQAHPDLKGDALGQSRRPSNHGTRALRHLPHFRPSWEIWTRTSPGLRLLATPTSTSNRM